MVSPGTRPRVKGNRLKKVQRVADCVDPARLATIGRWALNVHLTMPVVVILFGVAVGVRTWGLYPHAPVLRWLGSTLLVLLALQLTLGIGAALLACAVVLVMWIYRRLSAAPATSPEGPL